MGTDRMGAVGAPRLGCWRACHARMQARSCAADCGAGGRAHARRGACWQRHQGCRPARHSRHARLEQVMGGQGRDMMAGAAALRASAHRGSGPQGTRRHRTRLSAGAHQAGVQSEAARMSTGRATPTDGHAGQGAPGAHPQSGTAPRRRLAGGDSAAAGAAARCARVPARVRLLHHTPRRSGVPGFRGSKGYATVAEQVPVGAPLAGSTTRAAQRSPSSSVAAALRQA